MLNKSNLHVSIENAISKPVAVLSTTDSLFWCSESGGAMTCSRPWVQQWELFNFVKDDYSGKNMIQSIQTRKYAWVDRNSNCLYCTANSAVMEARFDINESGNFKCYNGKFVTNRGSGALTATSDLPVNYEIFDVMTVAIQGTNSSYARPSVVNGRSVISVDSAAPVRFYLLTSRATGASYLETENFQFTYPTSEIEPITFKQTQIDQMNFRYSITKPDPKKDYWTIKADFNNKYLGWDQSGTYQTCLFAKYDDDSSITSHFQLMPLV